MTTIKNEWVLTQTTDEHGNLLAVTFQDEEHVIKHVLWEAD